MHAFANAAHTYDEVAHMQREVNERLIEKLRCINIEPVNLLDLGAGTGAATSALKKLYPKANHTALDITKPMLDVLSENHPDVKVVVGDVEQLPFEDESFDLIYSSMMIHWCEDLNVAFSEIKRVLKPGGACLFSTLGPDSLYELRHSWAKVDKLPHVNSFLDMHNIGDGLMQLKFLDPVMEMEHITLQYPDVLSLMRDFKKMGADNHAVSRRKSLTAKSALQTVLQAYEQYKDNKGNYPVTYEVIYGHCWKAAGIEGEVADQDGVVSMPIKNIKVKKN